MTLSKLINKAVEEATKELKEKLADIEHQRWADWQNYLHSKLTYSEYQKDGKNYACYIMDAGDFEHWSRQIDTDYKDLTEKEKDSDREQVDRYLPIIKSFLTKCIQESYEEAIKKNNNILLELVKLRTWLVKEISGNEANIIMMQKYYQPQIDKIDNLLQSLTKQSKENK